MMILVRWLLVGLLVVTSGCAGLHAKRRAEDPWVREAETRLKSGDYDGAARIFEDLAERPEDSDYFRVRAADAQLRAGHSTAAQALLRTVDPRELDEVGEPLYLLLSARLALNAGRAREAMSLLNLLRPEMLDAAQTVHYHILRASAYNQLGQMVESAAERVRLGTLLTAGDAIRKNNEAIFETLNRLSGEILTRRQPPPPDPLGGWMALVGILRSAPPNELERRMVDWQRAYPGHPAAESDFLRQLEQRTGQRIELQPLPKAARKPAAVENAAGAKQGTGPTVAVLLPLSGAFADAGAAVRSGMLAAFYNDANAGKPSLRFVDTQSQPVEQLYRKEVDDGATLMVGPLLKEDVTKLVRSGELRVPTLALNQVPESVGGELFQFGLTPEQEVEQAAGAAWFDGHHQAAVLAPASPFGQRLTKHFTAYWRSLGGRVSVAKVYPPNSGDYAEPVAELSSLIEGGAPAESPGEAVADSSGVDFLFLIANARDARLIKPHLATRQLAHLPVYATSHVFSGRADARQDQDLDGIHFCDIPWLLDLSETGPLSPTALYAEIDRTSADYVKLIALGIDAYRLIPFLSSGRMVRGPLLNGATGTLSLGEENRILRQLECAQFEGGLPHVRGLAPVLRPSESPSP